MRSEIITEQKRDGPIVQVDIIVRFQMIFRAAIIDSGVKIGIISFLLCRLVFFVYQLDWAECCVLKEFLRTNKIGRRQEYEP